MRKLAWSFFMFLVSISSLSVNAQAATEIHINDEPTQVFFNDGDTFRILSGRLAGKRSRLEGFNTLESYGPVQRWGQASSREFLAIAHQATQNARRGGWHCRTDRQTDRYGRILSVCDDLAIDQIEKGLAHVMTISEMPGDPVLIAKQHQAIEARKGMWASGAPKYLITSLHSLDEQANQGETYDRFVSTDDGHSVVQLHSRTYVDCQEVCYFPGSDFLSTSPDEHACMLYVSLNSRFGPRKAECLR